MLAREKMWHLSLPEGYLTEVPELKIFNLKEVSESGAFSDWQNSSFKNSLRA
jgi:hypothetical protein